MATAPKPGALREQAERDEAIKVAQSIVTITYGGVPHSLAWQNLPVAEQIECRKQAGLPLASFTTRLGDTAAPMLAEDSIVVLVWLSRRAHDEPNLTFVEALAEWDFAKFEDITITLADPESTDPES
jgi:hypothetical protein